MRLFHDPDARSMRPVKKRPASMIETIRKTRPFLRITRTLRHDY